MQYQFLDLIQILTLSSPIMEGSSEDNDSHGKSHHSQHSTMTTLRHGSDTLGHSHHLHCSNTSSNTAHEDLPRIQEVVKTHTDLPHVQDAVMKSLESSMEQNEDTSYLLCGTPDGDGNKSHLVDISCYIPPELDEKTENLMSMSICIADPKDPFDTETIEKFLKLLQRPLESYDNYCVVQGYLPDFARGVEVFLGKALSIFPIDKK